MKRDSNALHQRKVNLCGVVLNSEDIRDLSEFALESISKPEKSSTDDSFSIIFIYSDGSRETFNDVSIFSDYDRIDSLPEVKAVVVHAEDVIDNTHDVPPRIWTENWVNF